MPLLTCPVLHMPLWTHLAWKATMAYSMLHKLALLSFPCILQTPFLTLVSSSLRSPQAFQSSHLLFQEEPTASVRHLNGTPLTVLSQFPDVLYRTRLWSLTRQQLPSISQVSLILQQTERTTGWSIHTKRSMESQSTESVGSDGGLKLKYMALPQSPLHLPHLLLLPLSHSMVNIY